MKISFATLGCPGWDLETICRRAVEYGYDGIDLRGYLDTLDITQCPEFTSEVAQTRRRLDQAGLAVSGISSSIRLCVPEALDQNIDEARRTIQVAQDLGVENIRVFGGGDPERFSRSELVGFAKECMSRILELPDGPGLRWLFETHDQWIHSSDCRLLLEGVDHPAFGALWDIGHTPRVAGETPAETYAVIGAWIGYTHIKDAVYDPENPLAMEDGWRYVFPGQGQVPLEQAVRLLHGHGYTGWLQFEHEKRWHPELPEPEEAFPAYAQWARPILASFS
jgi:sugar phosphate isomerase/epimerase